MGEIQYTNSLIMIGLFAIALVTFAINFAGDNDASISISGDNEFNNLNTYASGNVSGWSQDDVGYISSAYTNTTASGSSDVTEQGGQFKKGSQNTVNTVFSVLNTGWKKIFGQDNGFGVFLTALVSIIIFTFIRYQYKTWFGKQPD